MLKNKNRKSLIKKIKELEAFLEKNKKTITHKKKELRLKRAILETLIQGKDLKIVTKEIETYR